MRTISLLVLFVFVGLAATAQDTTHVRLLGNLAKPQQPLQLWAVPYYLSFSVPTASAARYLNFTAPCYAYQQGKLPLFCAFEDRIWRRTGLPMQFRIAERPIGSW